MSPAATDPFIARARPPRAGTIRHVRRSPLALALLLALVPATAAANGQSTHVWITHRALELLPEGPVANLLTRPELRDVIVNGTMFPDWGYAPGGSRDHGEASHWEPFQQEYRRWIQESFDAPYTEGEAAEHVAFLFGMASHGMADEHFDSLFMERSRCYDAGWDSEDNAGLDTASDVLFMAAVGGIPIPERWLPTDALATVYSRLMPELPLDVDGMEAGHRMLHFAVAAVDGLRTNEERLATFTADWGWSAEHLTNDAMPGSPADEAIAVAGYWLDLWERLQGTEVYDAPVLLAHPAPGSYDHSTDSAKPEARIHLALARGAPDASLDAVSVATADGEPVPMDVGLFYGNNSHALLARPVDDLAEDTEYVVTVGPGLESFDGDVFEGTWTATFSTGPAPPPQEPPADPPDDANTCGASLAPGAPPLWALLLVSGAAARRWRRRQARGGCAAPGGPPPG